MHATAHRDTSAQTGACSGETEELQARLLQLRQHSRSAWRCLLTLLAFRDFAHLARRLHCNHSELQALLSSLIAQLGAQHLRLESGRIQVSAPLQIAIEQIAAHQTSRTGHRHSGPTPGA